MEFGELIFLDHVSTNNWRRNPWITFFVLDGVTSHLTAYPCQSTSPSEVVSELREWMDTLQMNPKAMCADMAFHHPHDMQAFYRMHNMKTLPTGPPS